MSETQSTPRQETVPDVVFDHLRSAAQETHHAMHALLPKPPAEFMKHRRAARREVLLASRSLIDAALERHKE